jgi:hypothetical protein
MEHTLDPFDMALGLWNLGSCWWHCSAGWLVATKEEKLKPRSLKTANSMLRMLLERTR